MTVTDPLRTCRTGDARWEVLAGGSMTGGAVTFGDTYATTTTQKAVPGAPFIAVQASRPTSPAT